MQVRAVAMTGADQVIFAGFCEYAGFTIRETAGAAAVVQLWDNATTNLGTLLETIALAANASLNPSPFIDRVRADNGIFLKKVSGAFEGSVRVG